MAFSFPEGRRAALSLTFDDARLSQADVGLSILDQRQVRATFYVSTWLMEKRLDAWKQAVATGHEIGNHTLTHPCSINFSFSRRNGLETYTLDRMVRELDDAQEAIRQMVGVTPTTFAYPCGLSFVGRGRERTSYVPLVAERFTVGRMYHMNTPNEPELCDLAAVAAEGIDRRPWEYAREFIDRTINSGGWGILVAHDVGATDQRLSVDSEILAAICDYVRQREAELWTDTVAAIGAYVQRARAGETA